MCSERVLILRQMCDARSFALIHRELRAMRRERAVGRSCDDTLLVYLHSGFVKQCLDRWVRGWQRKAGPFGVWKTSRGK